MGAVLIQLGARVKEWEAPETSKGDGRGGTSSETSTSSSDDSVPDKGKGKSSGRPSSSAGYERKGTQKGKFRTHQGKTSKGKGKTGTDMIDNQASAGTYSGAKGSGDPWSTRNSYWFSRWTRRFR